jgi:hypothetical protein
MAVIESPVEWYLFDWESPENSSAEPLLRTRGKVQLFADGICLAHPGNHAISHVGD